MEKRAAEAARTSRSVTEEIFSKRCLILKALKRDFGRLSLHGKLSLHARREQSRMETESFARAQPCKTKACDWDWDSRICLDVQIEYGGVAQLGEHLLCKQGVIGSIPFISTRQAELAVMSRTKHARKSEFGVRVTV